MRSSQWILNFIALFCIASAKLVDDRNVLNENINKEEYLTDTGEYMDSESLEKTVESRISQLDKDDIADIREDIEYCMKMMNVENLFPGGSTKLKDVCPNIMNFFKCMDDVPKDFFGCDIEFLSKLFSDSKFESNIELYVSAKTMFQDMCSKDSILLLDDTPVNEDLAQCMKMIDIKFLLNGKFKTMDDVCPNLLGFYNCMEEIVKDTIGFDVAVLAKTTSRKSELGKYSRYFVKFKSIVQHMCPKVSALFRDVYSEEHGIAQCMEIMDIDKLLEENNPKLESLCPNANSFFACLDKSIKDDFGYDIAHFEKLMSGTDGGKSVTFFMNLNNIFKDFCSKDSAIYRDFKMDEECFETIYAKHTSLCTKSAKVAYETFNKIVNYKDKKDKVCIQTGYILGCSGAKIHEECGQRAFNTFIEVIRRLSVLQLKFCSQNTFSDLKTDFLESLNLDTVQQELFRKVFI